MKNILLLLLLITACACGSSDKLIIINKEYENLHIEGSKLGIVLPENIISIDSAGIVSPLGEGDSVKVYLKHFQTNFPQEVSRFSNLEAIEFSSIENAKQFTNKKLKLYPGVSIDFLLPANNEKIILQDCDSEFVLVFDDYSVTHFIDRNGPVGRSLELIHQFEFVIWDNTFGTIVSFGRIKIITYCAYPDLMSWESAIREVASTIFMGNCPFSSPI